MNPIVSQTTGSTDPAITALQGAALAFHKKKPAPPPPKKDNGALTAATSAGRPRSPFKPQSTGGSVADAEQHAALNTVRSLQLGAGPSQLHSGHVATKPDPKSASFIAATLAASRNSSPTPKTRTPGRRTSVGAASAPNSVEVVDSGSIAPTGSLISMFEQARAGDPVKRPSPKRSPVRSRETSSDSITEEHEPEPHPSPLRTKPSLKPKVKPKPRPLTPPSRHVTRTIPEILSPKPQRPPKPVMKADLRPKTPPRIITRAPTKVFTPPTPKPSKQSPKPSIQRPPTPPQPRGSKRSATQAKSKPPVVTPRHSTPRLAGPRVQANVDQRPTSSGTVSSDDTFVSASSVQSPEHPSPPVRLKHRRQVSASMPPSPTREVRRHNPKAASVTSLPLDSLTDAIMASSLASTRLTPHNTGGSLTSPPLPRRHKSPRLMQTLRQPVKASDEEERHKKGHLSKLHGAKKHSHHEGSRKRWREEITPRERKRYEAVWASNRGVLLDMANAAGVGARGDPSEYVLNVVVRQIWRRSRLPEDELAEVWDLVDRQGRGILGRQEFVVGMWLIDQRLRGRKIPARVSDSVWGSANGMKVMTPKVK